MLRTIIAVLLLASVAFAQDQPKTSDVSPRTPKGAASTEGLPAKADPKDVNSIDAIVAGLYDVISGPPGERNWQRFHSLFTGHAVLATVAKKDGETRQEIMTTDDYVRLAGPYFLKEGFFEREAARKLQTFGNIAHLFSTYESRHTSEGAPFARGINSIQLLNDGQRWWVLSILWDEEGAGNPIPSEYQPKK
jgi:hypothetical protein